MIGYIAMAETTKALLDKIFGDDSVKKSETAVNPLIGKWFIDASYCCNIAYGFINAEYRNGWYLVKPYQQNDYRLFNVHGMRDISKILYF
jgi:hypothetical protein